jgi:hypothetical protein
MFSINLEEFLLVLERYNLAIWPLQIFAYIFGFLALFFTIKRFKYSNQIILAVLSFFWLWTGAVFCPIYWAPTYKFAYLFGALCIIQGLLFLTGAVKSEMSFKFRTDQYSIAGILFIIYAIGGYYLVGIFLGHVYPMSFPFGLVPCPTAIFTFGFFLLADKKFPKYYLIIPVIVSLAGILAVYKGILEDIGLIFAGVVGTALILLKDRKFRKSHSD